MDAAACVNQVTQGDCNTEKPMWAAHGGLDFNGREAWDQWDKLKVRCGDDGPGWRPRLTTPHFALFVCRCVCAL